MGRGRGSPGSISEGCRVAGIWRFVGKKVDGSGVLVVVLMRGLWYVVVGLGSRLSAWDLRMPNSWGGRYERG